MNFFKRIWRAIAYEPTPAKSQPEWRAELAALVDAFDEFHINKPEGERKAAWFRALRLLVKDNAGSKYSKDDLTPIDERYGFARPGDTVFIQTPPLEDALAHRLYSTLKHQAGPAVNIVLVPAPLQVIK